MRYQKPEYSDVQVRAALLQPSLDCLVTRARLLYAGRIMRTRPRSLLALLHARKNGRRLPWVDLLATDVDMLRKHTNNESTMLSLDEDAHIWVDIFGSANR